MLLMPMNEQDSSVLAFLDIPLVRAVLHLPCPLAHCAGAAGLMDCSRPTSPESTVKNVFAQTACLWHLVVCGHACILMLSPLLESEFFKRTKGACLPGSPAGRRQQLPAARVAAVRDLRPQQPGCVLPVASRARQPCGRLGAPNSAAALEIAPSVRPHAACGRPCYHGAVQPTPDATGPAMFPGRRVRARARAGARASRQQAGGGSRARG